MKFSFNKNYFLFLKWKLFKKHFNTRKIGSLTSPLATNQVEHFAKSPSVSKGWPMFSFALLPPQTTTWRASSSVSIVFFVGSHGPVDPPVLNLTKHLSWSTLKSCCQIRLSLSSCLLHFTFLFRAEKLFFSLPNNKLKGRQKKKKNNKIIINIYLWIEVDKDTRIIETWFFLRGKRSQVVPSDF